jgi:hypothetical protein
MDLMGLAGRLVLKISLEMLFYELQFIYLGVFWLNY